MRDFRALSPTLVAVLALASACGGHDDNAPSWVLDLARQEAANQGEQDPDMTFAVCGPVTCVVSMRGHFRCRDCPRPPGVDDPTGGRLDVEINLDRRVLETRSLSEGG